MPDPEFLKHYAIEAMQDRARRMRKTATRSEDLLWQALRNRQLGGLKFLRQHPIGPTIVDFYCHERRLVLEVDGGVHLTAGAQEYDQARETYLENYGLSIVRCTATEVESDLVGVLEQLRIRKNNTQSPPPSL